MKFGAPVRFLDQRTRRAATRWWWRRIVRASCGPARTSVTIALTSARLDRCRLELRAKAHSSPCLVAIRRCALLSVDDVGPERDARQQNDRRQQAVRALRTAGDSLQHSRLVHHRMRRGKRGRILPRKAERAVVSIANHHGVLTCARPLLAIATPPVFCRLLHNETPPDRRRQRRGASTPPGFEPPRPTIPNTNKRKNRRTVVWPSYRRGRGVHQIETDHSICPGGANAPAQGKRRHRWVRCKLPRQRPVNKCRPTSERTENYVRK